MVRVSKPIEYKRLSEMDEAICPNVFGCKTDEEFKKKLDELREPIEKPRTKANGCRRHHGKRRY